MINSIPALQELGVRKHFVEEYFKENTDKKSGLNFKEILDLEMKKLEPSDRPKQNDSNIMNVNSSAIYAYYNLEKEKKQIYG